MAGGGVPSVSAALLLCIAATLFCANRAPRRLHVSNVPKTLTRIARHTAQDSVQIPEGITMASKQKPFGFDKVSPQKRSA